MRSHKMCLDGECHSFVITIIAQCLTDIAKKGLGDVLAYLSNQSC